MTSMLLTPFTVNVSCVITLCSVFVQGIQALDTLPVYILGECMALWGEPNELSIQHHVYIFMQYVDS